MANKNLPLREQPLGRLYNAGVRSLSTIELIAIIIGGPRSLETAQCLLETHNDLANVITNELETINSIGKVKAARLVAAIELGRRRMLRGSNEYPQIRNEADAAHLIMPWIGYDENESFAILYLNTKNGVFDQEILYKGVLNGLDIRVAEVFRGAVRRNCAAIIVAHNHPSGDPTPSLEDIAITRKIAEAGELLSIELLDHIVVSRNKYVSIRKKHEGAFQC